MATRSTRGIPPGHIQSERGGVRACHAGKLLFKLTRVLAALGKTLVSALLGDFLPFSWWWGVGVGWGRGGGRGWGRGGGGGRGDKNVVHIAPMPKTLVFTAFSLLCTTYCRRMLNKKSVTSVHAFRDHNRAFRA